MEFRLLYDGPLKATTTSNTRVSDKHAIRKQLHKQLAILWEKHAYLNEMKTKVWPENETLKGMRIEGGWFPDPDTPFIETFARRFSRCGFRFVPLVNKEFRLVCALDILFLRRENPGDLILRGGDIDNRVKTLLDALRIPNDETELPRNCSPDDTEDPFFCLLENDSLVTELKITTDRLLRPLNNDANENESNVTLVMHIAVRATQMSSYNLPLMS
jgi:hypothetical protein